MKLLKIVLSLFLAVLGVVSILGIAWWGSPPEALAGSASGGRFILGVTFVACACGLWQFWKGGRKVHDTRG